jgi:hypothetical protein
MIGVPFSPSVMAADRRRCEAAAGLDAMAPGRDRVSTPARGTDGGYHTHRNRDIEMPHCRA